MCNFCVILRNLCVIFGADFLLILPLLQELARREKLRCFKTPTTNQISVASREEIAKASGKQEVQSRSR